MKSIRQKYRSWVLPADGGAAFRLTHLAEHILSVDWAPDSSALIVLTRGPKSPVMMMVERAWRKRRCDVCAEEEARRCLPWLDKHVLRSRASCHQYRVGGRIIHGGY